MMIGLDAYYYLISCIKIYDCVEVFLALFLQD